MRTHYFILILSVFMSLVSGILLMSFQLPSDKNTLEKRIESLKRGENLDSLIYYQNLLIDVLEKENDIAALELAGQKFLELVLNATTLSADQKWTYLNQIQTSKAWTYAYKTQWYLESVMTLDKSIDSAYYYLSLLENVPQNKDALIYAYKIWAKDATTYPKDLRAATDYLKKAAQLIENQADSAQLYDAKIVVGMATGDFENALLAAKKMLEETLQQSPIDSVQTAFIYKQLGDIYYQQANYNRAKDYYVEAINFMAERSIYQREQAKLWFQLASCYFNLKNRPLETVLYLRKVFSLVQLGSTKGAIESSDIYLDACNMMALEFLEEKQLDSAQVYLEKMEEVKTDYKKWEKWSTKGKVHLAKKNYNEAEMAFQRAVGWGKGFQAQHPKTAARWLNLGDCYQIQKKYDQAQRSYMNALWALSNEGKKKGFPAINSLFSKEQAIQILTQKINGMLVLYERSKYSVSLTEIYNHAQYTLEVFRILKAERNLPLSFSDRTVVVYEQFIEVCELLHKRKQEQVYVKEAFQLAEECKAVLLQMMMNEPDAGQFGNVPATVLQKVSTLQQRMLWYQKRYWEAQVFQEKATVLDWYQQQMAALQVSLTLIKQNLQENHTKYYQFKYNTQIAILDSVQQALNDSTTLVQYLEGKEAIYQFIIQKDTLAIRRIFWRTYKPTILKYYKHFTHSKLKQHVQSGGYKDFCMTAYELYYKLMHHELLNKSKRVVIIPDGLLSYIPFETLLTDIPVEKVHEVNFPSLAYLLKQKQIAYNYSSTLWLNEGSRVREPINNEILGIGATYANEELMPIRAQKLQRLRASLKVREGVEAEIDSLSEKYAGDFYLNRYATEYYFKEYASSYGILHLGLYGMIDPDFPEYSSLIFSEDGHEEEDNQLTTNEIKQLNLNASMVVLSNCQTGYGPYQRGEGIVSLGRSFIYAGSPSVVLSLWEQSDLYGPIIMDYFYENLKQKIDKDVALRRAKLKYLKNAKGLEAHPAYWAGYIVIGNYQAIEVSEPVTYIWWFVIPIAFLGFLGWWSLQALRQRR